MLPRDAKGDVLDPWRLSELLMDVGAMSVSVDDSSLGTEDESPILQDHSNSKVFLTRTFTASVHMFVMEKLYM